ncbi:hypothetical protein F5877DRAFT_77716 [Lentinula edodes]|nr:hypothetical protein F5877DRAFT_77716 [Lentinula edodes]
MVDVISIVVAVLALLGTIAQAALSAFFGIYSEERKRRIDLQTTFSKYHDPLHLAADDLSAKLINIIDYNFASVILNESEPELQTYGITHTCFVFAQFFAWVYILRRDTEFLRPNTTLNSAGAEVIQLLAHIREILRSGHVKRFRILSGIQSAIGEITTEKEMQDSSQVGQLRCLGYAAFCERWADPTFRAWFRPIVDGLKALAQGRDVDREDRLLILQHLLSDLTDVLDPEHIHSTAGGHGKKSSSWCICRKCQYPERKEAHLTGTLGKKEQFSIFNGHAKG